MHVSVRVGTNLVNDECMVCVRHFLVWRVKEGNAARERTDAPIDHARRIEAHSPRMQNTKPLGPWYHCHNSNWVRFNGCVCVKCVIGIDMKSSIVKYRFGTLSALAYSCTMSETAKLPGGICLSGSLPRCETGVHRGSR